jgi:hypothetical protein
VATGATNILALALFLAFAALSALHVYWGSGGRWGARASAPQKENGSAAFAPSPMSCFAVALALMGFAYACLAFAGLAPGPLGATASRFAIVGIAAVFALRVVGDFRYFGIFKRVKGTPFARMDSRCYTPLCSALAAAAAWLSALG